MVRFNDKTPIGKIASNDILPITDMSDTSDDRKVTVEQLSQYTVDNISTLSKGKVLTDNNLTNELKAKYDKALNDDIVTNCITNAPNGFLENTEDIFTVKSGLEYLTSNGRNTDLTLKNKKNQLKQNLQIKIVDFMENLGYLFIVNGKLDYCPIPGLNNTSGKIDEQLPVASSGLSQIWFDTAQGVVSYSAKGLDTWVKTTDLIVLAKFKIVNNTITNVEKYYPVELIKRSDIDKLDIEPSEKGGGGGHVIGEFVPFTTSSDWLPEGFIPANGAEYASTGIFHELWNKYLIPNPEVKKPLHIPVLASNSTDGYSVSDSRNNEDAYTIFNGIKGKTIGRWNSYWFKLSCPIDNFCGYYSITANAENPINYPSDWKLQGSTNGSSWEDIETIKGQVFKAGETKNFVVDSNVKYKYYLITFLKGVESGDNGLIGKIHFYLNDATTILDTCTYEEYNNTLLEYGACPKWAVNLGQGKFKVPTIPTGYFIKQGEGTAYKAGLPNIKGTIATVSTNVYHLGTADGEGCLTSRKQQSNVLNQALQATGKQGAGISFDASKSNPIYGQSDTVQPKSVGLRWFIYVANSQLNESAIDWDLFVDSLNKAGTGLEIGDIGIAPLGINESENLRRYLNGQTIIQSHFKTFTRKLKAKMTTMPKLFCTNEQFESELTLSAKGQCGKFVIDDVAGTIRLPKIVNIQGLFDLQNTGLRVEAGLPNITGELSYSRGTSALGKKSNAFKQSYSSNPNNVPAYSSSNAGGDLNIRFNASDDNPIYGKSTTVQEEAIQYPYFIQVATGATEKDSVINEYQLNNPYSLLDCKWSDHKLNNISWLLSDGQLKSGTTYKAVYDLLLKEYNSSTDITEELFGVSITYRKGKETGLRITTNKVAYDSLLSKTGTAWFYVLDTAKTGFYLPQTNGMLQFGGTGEFVEAGLPNITGGINNIPAQTTELNKQWGSGAFENTKTISLKNCQSGGAGQPTVAPTFNASDSNPIYGKSTTVQPNAVKGYLYFYVGETVENANLIDAGKIETLKANKTEVPHLAMPSDRFVSLSLGAKGAKYIAPADGYFYYDKTAGAANKYMTWINITKGYGDTNVSAGAGAFAKLFPVSKGDECQLNYSFTGATNKFGFIYAEGSKE